jgi:hypothetical protein
MDLPCHFLSHRLLYSGGLDQTEAGLSLYNGRSRGVRQGLPSQRLMAKLSGIVHVCDQVLIIMRSQLYKLIIKAVILGMKVMHHCTNLSVFLASEVFSLHCVPRKEILTHTS